MKSLLQIFFLLMFLTAGSAAFAQSRTDFELRLYPVKVGVPFSIPLRNVESLLPGPAKEPSVGFIGGPVKYSAFFCKMELSAMKKLGVMVKVHAGDYDLYTRPSNGK